MRVRPVALIALSVTLLAFAIGCAKQEPPKPAATAAPAAPAADGKTLFEAKCSVCHGLDRATSLPGTKEDWTSIVKKMQGKKADWISDADASKIIDYLTTEHGKK
jgi:mono/diheme cytochrome c family protein